MSPRFALRCVLPALLGALLALAALLSVTEAVAVCEWSYAHSLSRPLVLEATGLDRTQVRDLLMHVVDYARGGIGRLQVQFPAGHQAAGAPVFTQREMDHMADVRELFARGRWLRGAALALLGLAAGCTVLAAAGPGRGPGASPAAHAARIWGSAFRWAAGWGTGLLALTAGLAVAAGFGSAFDRFHLLLFDNDLWQLPEESMLITLLPLGQFQRLALLIGAGFAACLLVFAAAGGARHRDRTRQEGPSDGRHRTPVH